MKELILCPVGAQAMLQSAVVSNPNPASGAAHFLRQGCCQGHLGPPPCKGAPSGASRTLLQAQNFLPEAGPILSGHRNPVPLSPFSPNVPPSASPHLFTTNSCKISAESIKDRCSSLALLF